MIKRLKKEKLFFLLFYLLPITFILGAAVVEFIFIILAVSLLFLYRKKAFINENKKFIYFFLAFYFYLNFNSFFSENNFVSFKSSVPYFRFLLIVLFISYFMEQNLKILDKKKNILIFIVCILFLDSSIQYIYGKNILGLPIIDVGTYRISSFFGSELILGSYITRILPILLSLIFLSKDLNKENYFDIKISLICLFSIIITLYSGERVAVFQVVLISLFTIFFLNDKTLLKKIFVIIILASSILILVSDNKIKTRLINNTILSFKEIDKHANFETKILLFSQVHHSHILSGYRMFKDSPVIGHGLKSFKLLCNDEKYRINTFSCSTHPHNNFILFLSEIGLIGLIFYFASLFYFLKNFIKDLFNLNKPFFKSKQCMAFSILFYYIPIPSGSFFNNYMSYQFYFLITFYLLFLNLSKKPLKNL